MIYQKKNEIRLFVESTKVVERHKGYNCNKN